MRELRELISRVAPAPSTVLIQGESGSGKELVARRLHAASPRREGPFVVVNCSATNPDLLESSLFGHEKGAFAGATCRRLGWFERATGGILFLDEISDLPAGVQAKLLRVLETGRFARLGGEAEFTADVRILCSTRKPLEELLQVGLFRDDLYYRINVVNIHIPPLREHAEDIPLLAEHFLERKALLCNKNVSSISDAAMRQLCDYTWPGNVRELENVIERAVVLATGERIDRIPALAAAARERTGEDLIDAWIEQLPENGVDAGQLLNALEKRLVLAALDRCGGIKTRAGRWLGFGERAKDKMRYLCDKYNIRAGGDE
jgi:Response regulator containing CheY-like receiver, AAA-type ATPase, and DNA-binding domains